MILCVGATHGKSPPCKVWCHRHCGSGDVFSCWRWKFQMLSLQSASSVQSAITVLFLKDMGWKHTSYHIINSGPGHTRSKQQLGKTLKMTFASLSRKSDEKEKKIASCLRSSRSQIFFKIGVLKSFAVFTGKYLCWSLFLIKLQVFFNFGWLLLLF